VNSLLAWFSLNVIGILPIKGEAKAGADPLKPCEMALERGEILVLLPGGSRGGPEVMGCFKRGITVLAARRCSAIRSKLSSWPS
jgi:1-acyl-sn-glycerol-3-phosphate acyltransferase